MTTETSLRAPGQFRSFLRAVHPRQALAFAVVVGLLVALLGRHPELGRVVREVLIAGAAVLVAQLMMGLANDLFDAEADRRSGATGKPVAEGIIPPGNVSFAIAVLLLLAIPSRSRTAPRRACSCWRRSSWASCTTGGCTAPRSPGWAGRRPSHC